MADPKWDLPYPSQRSPVMAPNIVATSQPLAAQAGLHILRSGGNAVDAAVATAAVMAVVEPCSNGLGADNFAIVCHQGKLHGLNASGRALNLLDGGRDAWNLVLPTSDIARLELVVTTGDGHVDLADARLGDVALTANAGRAVVDASGAASLRSVTGVTARRPIAVLDESRSGPPA